MSIALNDLIQISARTTYLGEECLNVFHYRVNSMDAGVTYEDVAGHFDNWWGTAVSPMTSSGSVLDLITILNLTNNLDIHQEVVNTPGIQGGSNMPSYAAWGFRLIRTTRLTRHGSKRFVGVIEETTDGNNPQAAQMDELNGCALNLGAGILISGTTIDITLTPVIIGRTLVNGVYVLDTTKVNGVSGAEFTRLTTQNSRKA